MSDCTAPLGTVCMDPTCPLHQRFRWERQGLDDGGLPAHLPMGVTEEGQGPEDDSVAHHYVCWCANPTCALTAALQLAWEAGLRQSL